MATQGKLICSYPGPAIEIPNLVFDDNNFLSELVNFLVHMNDDDLDTASTTDANNQSSVFKDTAHPRYITELLTGILRSVGHPADIVRISKRMGDDVVCNGTKAPPWRRSVLWILIRVALHTTLYRSPLGHHTYKKFMLFFMCCLAAEETCADLPNELLHFISAKISRRLWKLGTSAPDWLSRIVLETCTSLRSTIEKRWRHVQAIQRLSPPWAPSQLDLTRDTRLSLLNSGEYLRNSLINHSTSFPDISFNPKHFPRGVLEDFLSNRDFFEEGYRIEPHVTLYDVECMVEQGIDGWVNRVTNNDEACVKLETLADKYSSSALKTYASNPELLSVMLLTTIELWIALDKIAIKEIPMLVDYSPEVPTSLLEHLLLYKPASLGRLRSAHEYLTRRHSRSRSQWSVFSSRITADSFPIRFCRRSAHLRRLKTQIEDVARLQARKKVDELQRMNSGYYYDFTPAQIDVHVWPLPANQLDAEVIVFELDCPISFNMWRSATFHLLVDLCSPTTRQRGSSLFSLDCHTAFQPYIVKHPRSRISLGSYAELPISNPTTRIPATKDQACVKNWMKFVGLDMHTGIPVSQLLGRSDSRRYCTYKLQSGPYHNLQKYVDSTSHTPNEVLANQADCHEDLSIHEYMAFGHLRSGGPLQWLNILRELRSRLLSFRRHEVHMLLAQAVSQVGPLANTGWTWHQEINQPTFCHALLEELRSLVRDVEANWTEGVTMDTISFLLRRLLASSPDQAVTLEAIGLLRTVRSKAFSWIQGLSAALTNTPADEGLRGLLRDAAAICRSTFGVIPAMIHKVLNPAEDIDILLSSAMVIREHTPSEVSRLPTYSQFLLDRDRRLSLALENVASDIIHADYHDQGINFAVRRVWPDFQPGSKWTSLLFPNSRWFSCTTETTAHLRSQVVHFNVLDGSLLINGKPIGTWLPNEYVRHPLYKLIFGEVRLSTLNTMGITHDLYRKRPRSYQVIFQGLIIPQEA